MTAPLLSASQLRTSDECLRKWAFKYLAELPDPGSAAAQLGKDCHTAWESWLKSATPFIETAQSIACGDADYSDRIVRICTAGVRHLPPPMSPYVEVEGEFEFDTHGVRWRGYKDLAYWAGGVRILHDHKTTSNLRWAKSAEVLRGDVQLNLYAQHEFQRHLDIDALRAQWMYVTTDKQPSTRLVSLEVNRTEVDNICASLADRGKKLLKLYEERPDPNSLPLPEDLSICKAYGGCPFSDACIRSPREKIQAAQRYTEGKRNPMNFFDRIKQVKKDEPVAAPETPVPAANQTMREKLQAPPPSPGASGVVAEETIKADAETTLEVELVKSVTEPKDAINETAKAAARAWALNSAPDDGTHEERALEALAEEKPAPKPKAGPGRPRKTKPNSLELGADIARPELATVAQEPHFYTLYVNCLPLKSRPTLLGELLAPLQKAVSEQFGEDYRMVDYGKGREALVYALEELLKQTPPTGAVVINMKEQEANWCANVLSQYATEVVHGF